MVIVFVTAFYANSYFRRIIFSSYFQPAHVVSVSVILSVVLFVRNFIYKNGVFYHLRNRGKTFQMRLIPHTVRSYLLNAVFA